MLSRFQSKTEVQKLHRHFFVSNFDTGILMILGNIMSGVVLCFYGLSKSVPILNLLVTLKSIFSKLYTTSMDAAIRSINSKEEYFDFIAKNTTSGKY